MLMEEAFRGLQLELNRSAGLMIDFLPFDTLERIGNSLTFTAMGEALGKNVFPRNTTIFIDGRPAKANQITMATLDDHHASQRRALGLNHGHTILKHFFESIYAPVKQWVERCFDPTHATRSMRKGRASFLSSIILLRCAPHCSSAVCRFERNSCR
jgi:hypothetical protein